MFLLLNDNYDGSRHQTRVTSSDTNITAAVDTDLHISLPTGTLNLTACVLQIW